MDPTVTLTEALEAADRILARGDADEGVDEDALTLAVRVTDLDEWLCRSGALPPRWEHIASEAAALARRPYADKILSLEAALRDVTEALARLQQAYVAALGAAAAGEMPAAGNAREVSLIPGQRYHVRYREQAGNYQWHGYEFVGTFLEASDASTEWDLRPVAGTAYLSRDAIVVSARGTSGPHRARTRWNG